jgi:hypothetical protein
MLANAPMFQKIETKKKLSKGRGLGFGVGKGSGRGYSNIIPQKKDY